MVARRAHNPKVAGSSPAPATKVSRACTHGPFFYGLLFVFLGTVWGTKNQIVVSVEDSVHVTTL